MTEINGRKAARMEMVRRTAHASGERLEWVDGYRAGFTDGAQWAVERLPSRDEIAARVALVQNVPFVGRKQEKIADAVLALIRERYDAS